MSNRKELALARKNLEKAQAELAGVEALPRRVGSTVTWSNGAVWERAGDNAWMARDDRWQNPFIYPSAHVASGHIVDESGA